MVDPPKTRLPLKAVLVPLIALGLTLLLWALVSHFGKN